MDTSQNACCALDPLGHHALTCKSGVDLIVRHNALRDTFLESCKQACIGGHLEAGSSLDEEGRKTRPADILVQNWEFGKPAAFVTSPLNPTTLNGASVTAGSAASAAEARKNVTNDAKCNRLGWVCIPLAVETYGCWGDEVSTDSLRVSLLARLPKVFGCVGSVRKAKHRPSQSQCKGHIS